MAEFSEKIISFVIIVPRPPIAGPNGHLAPKNAFLVT